MHEAIKVGDPAPDFELVDQYGTAVKLSDLKGQRVLLSWHPFAFTGLCLDQMRGLERSHQRFADAGVTVLGLSVDPAPSKAAWAATCAIKNIQILSDFHPLGEVSAAYGVFLEDRGMSGRANVLLDANGVIQWVKVYELGQLPDLTEVWEQLEA